MEDSISFWILSISPGELTFISPDAILNILYFKFTLAPLRNSVSADKKIKADVAYVMISTGPGELIDALIDKAFLSISNPDISE